ncbi:MAG TPA: alpha/beta hydrolase [Acidimicrobiales bacterium]|nr:alpha/beta hydrolase [Acidimicrobiales bacterium]
MLRALAGGGLFGEVWGTGDPEVLVLHGWGRTHADFAAVVGPAAPGGALPSLAPDLPGFGSTPPPPTPWGAGDYASGLVRLLEEDGPGHPVVVLGHSRGGCIAVALAAARPDLVRALVLSAAPLVAAPGGHRRPAPAYRLARRLHRMGLVGDDRMERARQRYGSADYRAAEGIMRDVFVRLVLEHYDDELATLGCPVELVWGDDDTDVPVAVARAAAAMVPGATLTLCPGAGHLTPLSVPGELRAAVERALGRP